MRTTKTIVAALVALAIASPITADAAQKRKKATARPPCVSEEVMPALTAYTVKTQFMTAALSCGQEARDHYNQFVTMRSAELAAYSATMKKALGSRTNSFVTKVANVTGGQLDCEEAAKQATASADTPIDKIVTPEWAQERHGYKVCSDKNKNRK